MTREEAIEIVKKHGILADGTKFESALRELIPELAESEDERIKKIITDSVFYQYGAGVEYKDVLDYLDKLEKQKDLTTENIYKHSRERMSFWNEKQKEQEVDIDKLRRDLYQSGYNDGYQHGKEDAQKEQKPEWSEEELAKKHLEGYIMGREDTMREMKDFIESHFNCENAKKGTPIVYNTQSGTSTLKAEG